MKTLKETPDILVYHAHVTSDQKEKLIDEYNGGTRGTICQLVNGWFCPDAAFFNLNDANNYAVKKSEFFDDDGTFPLYVVTTENCLISAFVYGRRVFYGLEEIAREEK